MNNFNGLYIKSIREELELSLTEVAKAIGISPTTLSRIENCSLTCSKDIFDAAVEFFAEQDPMLTFNTTDSLEELKARANRDLKKWLTKFLLYSFVDDIDELKETLDNSYTRIRYSYIYFESRLLESFCTSLKTRSYLNALNLGVDLHLMDSFLSREYMFLLYDLMGLAHIYDVRCPKLALEYFKKAETVVQNADSSYLASIANYHTILALMAEMDHISALSLFDPCFTALQKAGAYDRIGLLEIYRGVCLQNLGLLREAEDIFKNIEVKVPQVDPLFIQKNTNENLMWLYLKQSRYNESRKCVELARSYGSVFPDLSLATAWSSYNLDSTLECRHVIQKEIDLLAATQRSEFVKSVLLLMSFAIEGRFSALQKQYRKVEESLPRFQNVEADCIVYSIMADYYTQNEDYQSAFAFEKKKVEYLLNRS